MMHRHWIAAGLISLSALGAAEAQTVQSNPAAAPNAAPPVQTSWPVEDWNPQANEDDYVVPLPCGGAMVFRRVSTGIRPPGAESAVLEDRQVRLGWSSDQTGYVDFFRSDYIAGPFDDERTHERFYYIGKYEVTKAQYDAVMQAPCPAYDQTDGALPATNLSWFDAVEFTRKLTNWLYANAPAHLPGDTGQPGYVRLPTEVEWEFAARGGIAVTDSERADKVFPMQGALTDYVWHAGPESSDGKLNMIGSLKGNPLHLHDVLGNVEELVLEPFRMNRVGRLHGQAGGFITKGGSYDTPAGEVRSAMRSEFPHFSPVTKGEMKRETFGFRAAIGGSVLGDLAQATELQRAWQSARSSRVEAQANPAEALRQLARQTPDAEMRSHLESLDQVLSRELALRNEVEGRAAKNLLMNAAVLRSRLQQTARLNDRTYEAIESYQKITSTDAAGQAALLQRLRSNLEQGKSEFQEYAAMYADVIQQLAADFPASVRRRQADELANDLSRSGRTRVEPHVGAVVSAVSDFEVAAVTESDEIVRRAIEGRRPWMQ